MHWYSARIFARFFCLIGLMSLFIPCALAVAKPPQSANLEWHISPTQINILVHDRQPLEILDAAARSLPGASWQVDNPGLAIITTEPDEGTVLEALAPGTVAVIATLDGVEHRLEIKIWPDALPRGTVKFSVPALGRSVEIMPAYPAGNSDVDIFSLEQDSRNTYVRGFSAKGIQRSLWTLPGYAGKLEIVCGDMLGGLLFSAVSPDSYTLYSVAPEGKLRWKHSFAGIRKGHTINYQGMLYLLNQSPDGFAATITAWDEETGDLRFTLPLPGSVGRELNLKNAVSGIICVPGNSSSGPMRVITSNLFTNIDGDAYVAFTHNEWTVGAEECNVGPLLDTSSVFFDGQNDLVLWRIHPDGEYESFVIDTVKLDHLKFGEAFRTLSPTGAIIPDGLNGVLLSVRAVPAQVLRNVPARESDFVYRITEQAGVAYKMALPAFDGPLHDAMVLGENDTGFATRGRTLLKFDVRTGAEIWRRDLPGVTEVYAALADGGIMVRVADSAPIAVAPPAKK
jgi:hypothetical protein